MEKCSKCGDIHRTTLERLDCEGGEQDRAKGVTQGVTRRPIVTQGVTATMMRQHCPTCSCQRVYGSAAEKQRAYRKRLQK